MAMLPVKFDWFKITSTYKLIPMYIFLSLICLTAQVWWQNLKYYVFFILQRNTQWRQYQMCSVTGWYFIKKPKRFEKDWVGLFSCFQKGTSVFWHEGSCFLTWREIAMLSQGWTYLYLKKKIYPDKTYGTYIASEHNITVALAVTHIIFCILQRLPKVCMFFIVTPVNELSHTKLLT